MLFLTGATGFVGGHLIPDLAARGVEARCLVRDARRAAALERLGFETVLGDLRAPRSLTGTLEGCRAVVHLASVLHGSRQGLEAVNVQGTVRLLRAAQEAGVRRFVHVSTAGAMDRPAYPYAYSAWQAERAVRQSRLDWVILKPTVIVGSGDPFTAGLIRMIRTWPVIPLPDGGRTRFQPLWIGDFLECLRLSLELPGPVHRAIPLGGGQVLTLRRMVELLAAQPGLRRPILAVPRRPLRWVTRQARRLGLRPPWVEGHFLGADHLAPEGLIEKHYGFRPLPFETVVPALLRLRRTSDSDSLGLSRQNLESEGEGEDRDGKFP